MWRTGERLYQDSGLGFPQHDQTKVFSDLFTAAFTTYSEGSQVVCREFPNTNIFT
jgi:hypothetical protein